MSLNGKPASSSASLTMRASRARPVASSSPVGETASVTPTIAAFPLNVVTLVRLPELEAGEVSPVAPLLQVLEIGHCAAGIAEEPVDAAALALVVVVAGRAVEGSDGADPRRRVQQLHPLVLSFFGHLDLAVPAVERVLDDHRDRQARFGEVVGNVRDEVGALCD